MAKRTKELGNEGAELEERTVDTANTPSDTDELLEKLSDGDRELFIELLKTRLDVAKKFTTDYQEQVEKNLEDYDPREEQRFTLISTSPNVSNRYSMKIPYIFATHDSMMASLFDKLPALIISARGRMDEDKRRAILAAYEYITDKSDIYGAMTKALWWFILSGFVSANTYFELKVDGDGNAVVDEPRVDIDNPFNVYFAPTSEFTEDGRKVPYAIRDIPMYADDVEDLYGITLENNEAEPSSDDEDSAILENSELSTGVKDSFRRVVVHSYRGSLPKKFREMLGFKEVDVRFAITFTKDKILSIDVDDREPTKLGKLYGEPNKFFGFGIASILSAVQRELGQRRSQELVMADRLAFPKILVEQQSKVDVSAIVDPRGVPILRFTQNPPQYLRPPDISNNIVLAEEKARSDAQFISGMMDMSRSGNTQNVVKTATGQTIFAEEASRRMRRSKRAFARFYRAVMIDLLKLAAEYWQTEKVQDIVDGNEEITVKIDAGMMHDIDFDKDIDFDMESVSINKEVLRAQAIELYNISKNDPLINRREVVRMVLRDGFGKKDPDEYIVSDEELQAEQQQGQQEMGAEQPLAEPSGDQAVPSDIGAIVGRVQDINQ